MNWTKLFYVFIIALIYVPMVFLGSNVFFPKYTGINSYYQGPYDDCYNKYSSPATSDTLTDVQQQAIDVKRAQCQEQQQEKQRIWEEEKRAYEGPKYLFIVLFNLAVLLMALFVPKLQDSVMMGLFLGSTIATFSATMIYFDTNSKLGFGVLVVTFLAILFFINRKKDSFVDWKREKS
ncbi:hypothetical protein HYX14_03590 [Candidatus Woesearchaeota archaeon]|nr:hypothetical protein [Candidatus Woesearchaeota archaeon]